MRAGLALVLLAASCGGSAEEPGWTLALEDAPHSVLSCWSSGPDDVLFVGSEGSIRRWDGQELRTLSNESTQWLWWIWGCSPDDAWTVGEGGTILRVQGERVETVTSPTEATLWGVWGPSCDDVWIVGGSPLGPETDLLLRDTGAGFQRVGPEPLNLSFFKVWGSAPDDVVVVGEAGVIWRWGGKMWSRDQAICPSRLFTVHGRAADDIVAVGQQCAIGYDGTGWSPLPGLDLTGHQPNGVFVAGDGSAVIVGFGATKARRTPEGEWIDESELEPIAVDFHGACDDGRGGFYAVGGNFINRSAEQRGVIAHWGVDPPALGP